MRIWKRGILLHDSVSNCWTPDRILPKGISWSITISSKYQLRCRQRRNLISFWPFWAGLKKELILRQFASLKNAYQLVTNYTGICSKRHHMERVNLALARISSIALSCPCFTCHTCNNWKIQKQAYTGPGVRCYMCQGYKNLPLSVLPRIVWPSYERHLKARVSDPFLELIYCVVRRAISKFKPDGDLWQRTSIFLATQIRTVQLLVSSIVGSALILFLQLQLRIVRSLGFHATISTKWLVFGLTAIRVTSVRRISPSLPIWRSFGLMGSPWPILSWITQLAIMIVLLKSNRGLSGL